MPKNIRNVIFMPTCVNLQNVSQAKVRKKWSLTTLGFLGPPSTTIFLDEVLNPLAELTKTHDFELMIFSAQSNDQYEPYDSLFKDFKERSVKIRPLLWTIESESQILGSIDIGLAPLSNRKWDKYKGGYKVINYMAAGVPLVASAVGEHNFIIKDGFNGFLCKNHHEWTQKLQRLIEDETLKESISRNARRTAEEKYSLQRNVRKLAVVLGRT